MPAEECAIGVDLGGTKIAAGAFDAEGRLRGRLHVAPTRASGPGGETVAALLGVIGEAIEGARREGLAIRGIGAGSTGPLDPARGMLLEAETLPNLFYFPLREAIEARFQLPVRLTNDGNAFALAEALHGAGRGHGIVVGVTIGTGCGCGIVIHGRILEGNTANTGEVYRAPTCGRTFDEVISGPGLEGVYRERSGRARSGAEISRLADGGDEEARGALRAFGRSAGEGLGILAAVIDPSVIVLGGSVSAAFPHFGPALREELARRVAPRVAASLTVVPSGLGELSGALGGASLHFSGETIR